MPPDTFNLFMHQLTALHHHFNTMIDVGFLVFARMLGFILIAPVLGRKDVPFTMKIGMAFALTLVMMWVIPLTDAQRKLINSDDIIHYILQVFINISIGFFIGFIAECIMEVISAAGSLMNNQIGLSSALVFDPNSRTQVAILDKLFAFIGLMVFFQIGGFYWIINAIHRSFEVFPLYSIQPDIVGQVSLDYLIHITGNSLLIATILIAPVLVVTVCIDLILGIVNRTAQQIQVFQLSFALKPSIGMAVFLATLPIFLKLLENYLTDYASIF